MSDLHLLDPLEKFPTVGRIQAGILKKLGLKRLVDVLFFFPRDYEDYSSIVNIAETQDGDTVSLVGQVVDQELVDKRGGRSAFYLLVQDPTEYVRAIWFNQPYRAKNIAPGIRVMLSGQVRIKGLRREMVHPRMVIMDDQAQPEQGSLLPVYRLTEGIRQQDIRQLVRDVFDAVGDQVVEVLPESLRQTRSLPPIDRALSQVHFPQATSEIEPARNRFVFQELLTLQLAILMRREQVRHSQEAPVLESNSLIDARIRKYFPYELTAAQNRCIQEIVTDIQKPVPMNRLLHGDVGCGKTSIALYGLLLAVANGYQGILMAPTETLARQHYRNFMQTLAASRVEIVLLTGSLSTAEKKAALQKIADGTASIVIGTQALIQEKTRFDKPGLVVVDEQHRFGVRQRAMLRQKATAPHYLVMTATPIPRTVAMTLFGDLDVSRIDEKPPNRPPVHTYLCDESRKPAWWEFVRKKLRAGQQAYIIAPLVDEHEKHAWENVEQSFENLANGELAEFTLDLVHGSQSAEDKDLAMQRFANGQTQVLVATSVVEVGIDVPNASTMTILSANRFGLSQLHQLRGRVGRGQHAGFVSLFVDSGADESLERLKPLVEIEDGFQLAEADFQSRGPGDLFGTRQHGIPPLFVADLQKDQQLLLEARQEASRILDFDPKLSTAEFAEIRKRVIARYGKSLELSDVS